jgi:protein SCO1/2
MHGEVLRLDEQGKIAAIKAGKIGDWMEAMTMEYPVKDKVEFEKLRIGQTIDATVYVQGNSYWVSDIREGTPSAPTAAPASK